MTNIIFWSARKDSLCQTQRNGGQTDDELLLSLPKGSKVIEKRFLD
jgi:hypothetical protein